MIIEIKSIYGKSLYSSEATSLRECLVNAVKDSADLRLADLRGADLRGADLRRADLQGADLQGAYLQWAYLRRADLQGADLRRADLRGAYLQGNVKISLTPISVDTPVYSVMVFDKHMRIGCEFHAIAEWWAFDDNQIAAMDGDRATQFWAKWKAPLQAICAAESRA